MHHQDIKSALRHGFGTAEASIGHQSAKLDGLQSSLTQISIQTNDSMTKWDQLEMNQEGKDRRLLQTLDGVSDRLKGVSSMSLEQSSTVQQLARMIEGLQLDLQGMRHDLLKCVVLSPLHLSLHVRQIGCFLARFLPTTISNSSWDCVI